MTTATARFLTPPEVGRRLGVKPARVIGWIRAGKLRGFNLSDGQRPRFRIDPSDLAVFLARRAAGPTPKVTRRRRNPEITQFF